MKLKDYMEVLNQMATENPEILELEVITASDDEGNSFNPVNYTPTVGEFGAEDEGFTTDGEIKNAICLN